MITRPLKFKWWTWTDPEPRDLSGLQQPSLRTVETVQFRVPYFPFSLNTWVLTSHLWRQFQSIPSPSGWSERPRGQAAPWPKAWAVERTKWKSKWWEIPFPETCNLNLLFLEGNVSKFKNIHTHGFYKTQGVDNEDRAISGLRTSDLFTGSPFYQQMVLAHWQGCQTSQFSSPTQENILYWVDRKISYFKYIYI